MWWEVERDRPGRPSKDFKEVRVFLTKGKSDAKILKPEQAQHVWGTAVWCHWSSESERVVVCGNWKEVRVRKGAVDPAGDSKVTEGLWLLDCGSTGLPLEASDSRPDLGLPNIPLEALAGTQATDSSDQTRGVPGSQPESAYSSGRARSTSWWAGRELSEEEKSQR